MKKRKIIQHLILLILCFFIYSIRNLFDLNNFNINNFIDFDFILIVILFLMNLSLEIILKIKNKKIKWFFSITSLIIAIFHTLMPSINIAAYVLVFYFLIIIAFFSYIRFKLSFEISLGFSTMLLLFILLLLSVFNLLILTKFILILIVILEFIYLLFYYKNKNTDILNDIDKFMNFTFLFFSILFIIAIINGFERYVNYWDEYNMWALSAKKVIFSNNISGFSYPPVMALWHYFINLFDTFKEPNLYIGQSIFIYIFIISIFSCIKNMKNYTLLAIISLLFCYMFGSVYNYNNLYADYPMAIVFGFSLIILYVFIIKQKKSLLYLILPSIFMVLIKPQGFVLSTCLILISVLYYSLNNFKWNLEYNKIKNNCLCILKKYWIIIIPALIYIIWTLFSSVVLDQKIFISDKIEVPGISDTFLDNINLKTLFYFWNNAIKFLDTNILSGIIDISIFNFYLLINISLFFIFYLIEKDLKSSLFKTIPYTIASIVYFFLTALSLLVKMPISDALNLASFARYLDNFNVGIFMFVIWMTFVELHNKNKIKNSILIFICLLFIISVPISKPFSFVTDLDVRYENRTVSYENVAKFEKVLNHTSEDSKIYVIDQRDESGYLPMCLASYYLYPRITNANGQINWRIQTKTNTEEWILSSEKLQETLVKNKFDYLFLYSSTEEFFDEISYMFDDVEIAKDFTLFKIVINGDSIQLIPIG